MTYVNKSQASLPIEWDGDRFQTTVISHQRDFDALSERFTELRAISYVSSASLLPGFLDNCGFERIEFLVGDNVDSGQLKDGPGTEGRCRHREAGC